MTDETQRDRVRRVLIAPLEFRFAKGDRRRGADGTGKDWLAGLCDELGYLTDNELGRLRECLQSKGLGRARDCWPSAATVRGFAEAVRPRPVEELPCFWSWFRSVEGPRARAAGTLVATWEWIRARKVPPSTLPGRQWVEERAADHARRLRGIAVRKAQGRPVDAADLAFLDWYRERLAYLDEVVRIAEAAREKAATCGA